MTSATTTATAMRTIHSVTWLRRPLPLAASRSRRRAARPASTGSTDAVTSVVSSVPTTLGAHGSTGSSPKSSVIAPALGRFAHRCILARGRGAIGTAATSWRGNFAVPRKEPRRGGDGGLPGARGRHDQGGRSEREEQAFEARPAARRDRALPASVADVGDLLDGQALDDPRRAGLEREADPHVVVGRLVHGAVVAV